MNIRGTTTFALTAAAVAGLVLAGAARPAVAQKVEWNMQSTYSSSLTQLGSLGLVIADRIKAISGGDFVIHFQEPGAIVPALEAFDAVSAGAIESAWSTPGYWTGKEVALALFATVPFGPSAGEYTAWIYFGGGQQLLDEIYAKYNIKSLICGVIAPEASGWFRKEIKSVDDLKGLKMRFFGLGARVMEKMGVSTQLLAGGDIFPALELGTIDATEFSMPAIDLKLGFYQVAKHYYFPGWHQQSTLFELMMNKDVWDRLSDVHKAQLETVCQSAIAYGLAEGEAIQFAALKELQAKGVIVHRWPPEILDKLHAAWDEVAAELVAQNPTFAKVWESLSTFRANYKIWKDLGYL
ncbi:TRAP-type mannitol/chloroaromatic compound transport system, substrate-binding protein [Tistlia consotensis]|uniref:TRAP-type mannitol/chloroaromatic compound transport system, substrate-binding protein n=1 Tax=Tistlia consotensis USBA 355 TaxID=560819 RepID=A0A1Y6B3I8_9PROT|nr:TRAP transporter substrate-binding protein [Tistlia consotensis]SME89640.1 TRAP-type mannitol/chloroaromatic compound transport system, substrate-binding protein [Tistlia consotensis USBA 355]SNR26127.1 TRAP-type mannitol/chloroaromatic compound transport system, substrate-binding protein [Tistlia consotensis]